MKIVEDEIYCLTHGLQPVRRGRSKDGESEWYYLDPRYDEDDERREIEVEGENAANPLIDEILADDMAKNPDNYYIWCTMKDERVRDTHAAREGEIFNWHVPPEDGHPGEAHNCRCWAEPYVAEEVREFLKDTYGIEEDGQLPAKVNLSGLPQYGKNDEADVKYNSNDEFLFTKMWENIKAQEKIILYPYLDTKGLITIGAGANVNDWNVFKNLNVTVAGIPATEAQKREAYKYMRELSEEKDERGNYLNRNRLAESFKSETNIRMSDAEARKLAQNHMTKDLAHLRREFSDFDSFPLPLKEVLLDIQYNTGNLNQQKWSKLYKAIKEKKVFGKDGIIESVNRKDVQQKRNDWAKRMARSIRF